MVNRTNERYQELGIALIQKIPTPITPIEIDKASRHITLAYFDKQSTVDYIGAVQGLPVCFDAKECAVDTFALANVHEHQITFMQNFEEQGGIAFFLIFYSARDMFYYMPLRDMLVFRERAQKGGRKSIRFDELDERFFIDRAEDRTILIPYLEAMNTDLELREED